MARYTGKMHFGDLIFSPANSRVIITIVAHLYILNNTALTARSSNFSHAIIDIYKPRDGTVILLLEGFELGTSAEP